MLTRFTILSLFTVLLFSCVTKRSYNKQQTAHKKTIRELKKQLGSEYSFREETLKKEIAKTEHSLDSVRSYSTELLFEKSELVHKNKQLKKAIDSGNIDPLGLLPQIDSLEESNSRLNLRQGTLQEKLLQANKTSQALGILNDSLHTELKALLAKNNGADFKKEVLAASTLSKRIPFRKNTFDIFVVDIEKNELLFFWRDTTEEIYTSLTNVKKAVEYQNKELIFATNAGIYKPGNTPEGLYIENNMEMTPVNLKQPPGYLNFYMNFGNEPNSNGIFLVDSLNHASIIKAKTYHKTNKKFKLATQSGPLMLYNGKMNPRFNKGSKSRKIRNGVGIIDATKVVFIISNKPVNFYDFASVFKERFGCKYALYLDGVISKMYLPEINRNQLNGNFAAMIGVAKSIKK